MHSFSTSQSRTLKSLTVIALIAIAFIFVPTLAKAQFESQFLVDSVAKKQKRNVKLRRPADTAVIQKHFGRAAAEWSVMEFGVWGFDRYVTKKDYAVITGKSTVYNLNPAHWQFDNDPFQTNQFGHPYHGSYFYSAFRTNGYSFWQAAPAAFAGSYLWETFAENQAPAPNDFINTSFGGVILGEMTYRFSNKIVNNRRTGFKRQMSEVFGLLVNPMNGLNRILDGKWGKVYGNPIQHDSSKISAEFDAGYRQFNGQNTSIVDKGHGGWFGRARLLYGTPYEGFKEPFTNIVVNAEFGKDDSSAVNVISVYGSLTGWKLRMDKDVKHLLILSANYDYIRNEAFFYGAQSVKMNLVSQYDFSKKVKLSTSFGAGPVILAAVPDDYLFKGRNYDYGTGAAINGGGRLDYNKFYISVNYRGGWTKTLSGNAAHYFLHTASAEVGYAFTDNVSFNLEPGYFTLRGYYHDFEDVDKNYPYLRASVRYKVNL